MYKIKLFLTLFLFTVFNFKATAQSAGSLDTTFKKVIGAHNDVDKISIQSDGKIIMCGIYLARLKVDGILDPTFNTGTGPNSSVRTTSIQTDGKIIIGGDFTMFNGMGASYIARLNMNGSLDTSFHAGANGQVKTTSIQTDGKIIIGGEFNYYNGAATKFIARVNVDGSLDTTFNMGTGANYHVYTTSIQTDGKIIIGGNFSAYNGIARSHIARLNADGSLDTSFNPGGGANLAVAATATQTDGKIIIGGMFNYYSGTLINCLARLNVDGSRDTSFNAGIGANNYINAISIQADGKIIIGGNCDYNMGIASKCIIRLNVDGTLDTSFNTGTGANNAIFATAIQTDGKIIIGGWFTSYNGTTRKGIARLLSCGSNASYTPNDNGNGNYSFTNTSIGSFNQTHWAFGDGTTSTMANPNHTYSANGTYVVVLTVNDSALSSSCMDYYLDTIVVTGVVAPLQCAAGFVMYPDAGDVIVINSSTGTNLTYFWNFGDGSTSTQAYPTHTYAASGPYYLCLTVDDGAGCNDMYCDSIGENGVVFNKQTGFTINVIAPPLVTQISEQVVLTFGMIIYPNPTGNTLNIVLNEKEHYQLKIVTIDGKLLESKTIVGNTSLNVSRYTSGMYFITATNNEGKVYQSKFVKE